jgi:hypothetical protein
MPRVQSVVFHAQLTDAQERKVWNKLKNFVEVGAAQAEMRDSVDGQALTISGHRDGDDWAFTVYAA